MNIRALKVNDNVTMISECREKTIAGKINFVDNKCSHNPMCRVGWDNGSITWEPEYILSLVDNVNA